jgi:predicted nucleic acid-binding protein
MNKVFIDTDVLMDFLSRREPFQESALKLVFRIDRHELEGITSAQSIGNLAYLVGRTNPDAKVRALLANLMKLISIVPVTGETILAAIGSSIPDLEDAIQCQCAYEFGAEAIITRNLRDYRGSALPVFDPESFESYLQRNP